ncbi:hypothetical protein M3J09_012189 [Ascochyta lentis]
MSTTTSTATTPRSSIDLVKSNFKISTTSLSSSSTSQTTQRLKSSELWQSIKRRVREHHESVNAVYANYYGQGHERRVVLGQEHMQGAMQGRSVGKGEVWVYERGVYGRL